MELTLLAFLVGGAIVASPGSIPLEKITDSTILPPGVTGTFIIGSGPESCLGDVFFTAFGDGARIGLYAATPQGLTVVANPTIRIPESTDTFQNAVRPTCAEDKLLFLGKDDLGPMSGGSSIYSFSQGVIDLVFEVGTPIGSTHFTGFNSLDASESEIVVDASLFPSSVNQAIAVIPFDGPPFIVADRSTILPGQTDPVTILAWPILVGSDVVFHGRTGSNLGIYRWREGEGITIVADTDTPVPLPGQGNFGLFGLFTNLGGRVVFEASYFSGTGLFAFEDGELEPVVLPGELTAEGVTLAAAEDPTGAGDLLSFIGRAQENPFLPAVFVKKGDGPIQRILGVDDTLEGAEVDAVASNADDRDVLVWSQSFDFSGINFIHRARFAAALTDIPALSWYGLAALGLGLALSGWWALRRLSGRL